MTQVLFAPPKHPCFRRHPNFSILSVIIFFLFVNVVYAQVAPQLSSLSPRAAQRGQTIEVTLVGKNIDESAKIWLNKEGIKAGIKKKTPVATVRFTGSGISANIPNDPRLVLSFEIAPDAPLGNHQIRLITPNGVSNPQNFMVGDLPEMKEQEPNSTYEESNMLKLPVTLNGTVSSIDDVDIFHFNLRNGARLICDIFAQRIGSPLDSYMVLYDPNGAEVVKSLDGNGLDSFIDYTNPTGREIHTPHSRCPISRWW